MPEKKSKSKKWIVLVIILVVLVLGIGGGLAYYLLNPVYIITGKAIDTDNNKPVKGLKVQADNQESITGDNGIYELKNVKKNTSVNYTIPSEYVQTNPQVNYNEFTKVDIHTRKITQDLKLNPTEAEKIKRVKTAVEELYQDDKFARYAEAYDKMHPDCQALISKDDFIKTQQENFKGVSVTDIKLGNVKFLDKWHFDELNKDYNNVAEVETSINALYLGMNQTINQLSHFVKVGDQWRWFYIKK